MEDWRMFTNEKSRPGMVLGGVIEKMRFLPGGKRVITREVLWVRPEGDNSPTTIGRTE